MDLSGAVAETNAALARAAAAAPAPPLLTSEAHIIPPEAPSALSQGQDEASILAELEALPGPTGKPMTTSTLQLAPALTTAPLFNLREGD